MTTVVELTNYLEQLIDEGHGACEVMATHGASGVSNPVGTPYLDVADDLTADILGVNQGDFYVDLYIGN